VAQAVKHHVDEHCAALDIHRAGAVDAVAGNAEVEVVGLLFDLRENRVQVGDKPNRRRRCAILQNRAPRQHQMAAVTESLAGHRLGLEAQRGEAFGGQLAQPVDAARVQGEAVDEHHLVQQVEIDGPVVVQIGMQVGVGGSGVHGVSYSTEKRSVQPLKEELAL